MSVRRAWLKSSVYSWSWINGKRVKGFVMLIDNSKVVFLKSDGPRFGSVQPDGLAGLVFDLSSLYFLKVRM
jgi:hypothetical protein